MICPNCGATVDSGDSFCGVCGIPMASGPVAPVESVEPAPVFPGHNALLENEAASQEYNYGGRAHGDSIKFSSEPEAGADYRNVRTISEEELRRPLSALSYIGIFITLLIPVFNIVMVLWWAFSRYTNKNKRHIAAAVIILWALVICGAVAAYTLLPEVKAVVDLYFTGLLSELGVELKTGLLAVLF